MADDRVARAERLLTRAAADRAALEALATHPEVSDEILGFHAKQAAEKLLKAVLTRHGVEYPRTHSLRSLLDLLADQALTVPAALDEAVECSTRSPSSFGTRSPTCTQSRSTATSASL